MTAQASPSFSEPPAARQLTAHPLFPAGIGVWFAVLFSLSSLAIRGSLLEALVVVTHIDYLIPAASPPLGTAPRAIMALLIAALGYHIGRKVGLRIAQSEADATRTVSEPVYGAPPHEYAQDYAYPGETAPRRPFQVHEEVGGHYPEAVWPEAVGPEAVGYGAGEYGVDPAAAVAPAWGHDAASPYQAQYAGQYPGQYPGEYQQPYPGHDPHEAFAHQPCHQEPQPYELGQEAVYGAQYWQPAAAGAPYPVEAHPAAAFGDGWSAPQSGQSGTPAIPVQAAGGYFAAPHDAGFAAQPPVGNWASNEFPQGAHQPAPFSGEGAFAPGPASHGAAADFSQAQPAQAQAQPAWVGNWAPGQGEQPAGIYADSVLARQGHAPVPGQPDARAVVAEGADWPQAGNQPAAWGAEPDSATGPLSEPVPAAQNAAERIAEGTLEKLSNVELMERLAIAMQRHETAQPAGARAEDRAEGGSPVASLAAEQASRAAAAMEMPAARSALAALRGLK